MSWAARRGWLGPPARAVAAKEKLKRTVAQRARIARAAIALVVLICPLCPIYFLLSL
jgi:hypothetical protein